MMIPECQLLDTLPYPSFWLLGLLCFLTLGIWGLFLKFWWTDKQLKIFLPALITMLVGAYFGYKHIYDRKVHFLSKTLLTYDCPLPASLVAPQGFQAPFKPESIAQLRDAPVPPPDLSPEIKQAIEEVKDLSQHTDSQKRFNIQLQTSILQLTKEDPRAYWLALWYRYSLGEKRTNHAYDAVGNALEVSESRALPYAYLWPRVALKLLARLNKNKADSDSQEFVRGYLDYLEFNAYYHPEPLKPEEPQPYKAAEHLLYQADEVILGLLFLGNLGWDKSPELWLALGNTLTRGGYPAEARLAFQASLERGSKQTKYIQAMLNSPATQAFEISPQIIETTHYRLDEVWPPALPALIFALVCLLPAGLISLLALKARL